MEIRYTASRKDVRALLSHNLRHSARLWIMLLAVALFPVALDAVFAVAGHGQVTAADVKPGFLIGLVFALAVPVLAVWRTKRDERVLRIGAAGIETTVGKLVGAVPWARVASVGTTPEYIFITGKNANGFAIPTRVFKTEQDRAEFLQQLDTFRQAAIPEAAI